MIHERVIDIQNDTEQEQYFDDNGNPITQEQYNDILARKTTAYVCPACGSRTFGRFEPFVERGIDAWCSNCGHMVGNRDKIREWCRQHPENVDRDE